MLNVRLGSWWHAELLKGLAVPSEPGLPDRPFHNFGT